ncbi:DUF6666 family protein [Aeoliella sp.]|uniref:DUF6666 family protein n=1 Tax=Aeoliella sp. TaxID=2795800 RepID=UPI003CCC103D
MQRLPKCIATTSLAVFTALVFSTSHAQQLQWVHSSQQKARSRAATPVRVASAPQQQEVEVIQLPAKQPTFRQPQAFQQSEPAKPLTTLKVAPRHETIDRQMGARQVGPDPARRGVRMAAAPVRRVQHEEGGAEAMPEPEAQPKQQYEEVYRGNPVESGSVMMHGGGPMMMQGGPMCDCDQCQSGSMYYGEAGCGCPEPTCGCVGGCFLGEPGCGVGYGCEPVCGVPCGNAGCCEPGCAAGCCGDCVDGCCTCGDACCDPCCSDPCCGDTCCDDCPPWPEALFGCGQRGCVPILWVPPMKEFTVFGGVQGFKGPLDAGRDRGNFGFHEGFNLGGKMAWLPYPGLGYQVGWQATHSQLSGDFDSESNGAHSQQFVTAGLFHRNRLGFQYGVVWDMLRDERQGSHDFGQVRGKIGFKNCTSREFGFLFSANTNENRIVNRTYHAANQYLFYYRILGRQGGDCRAFAGFTGDSNAVLGSDFQLPVTDTWALEGNWRYLVAEGGSEGSGSHDEGWNIGLNLVWHYGCRAKCWNNRPYRPMFDVANNGSLIVVD